jgi:hypothetical protein
MSAEGQVYSRWYVTADITSQKPHYIQAHFVLNAIDPSFLYWIVCCNWQTEEGTDLLQLIIWGCLMVAGGTRGVGSLGGWYKQLSKTSY